MGLQIVLPELLWFNPFLSFIAGTLKAAQRRSSGCPEGAKGMSEQLGGSTGGGLDEELA